jgi:hypothetical protein
MTDGQLLAQLKDRIGSHPDWPGGPVTPDALDHFLATRSRQATTILGVRPTLVPQTYAAQMAEIAEMEQGFPLPGLSP